MAKSKETYNKKEKEKQRLKQKQDKIERKEQRKANASKGKTLDEMMAYVDEEGNISSTPPDPGKRKIYKTEDIQIGVPKYVAEETSGSTREGKVSFFNEAKGFGFITDSQSGERVFVHISQCSEQITENDKVSFEIEMGARGIGAKNVVKLDK